MAASSSIWSAPPRTRPNAWPSTAPACSTSSGRRTPPATPGRWWCSTSSIPRSSTVSTAPALQNGRLCASRSRVTLCCRPPAPVGERCAASRRRPVGYGRTTAFRPQALAGDGLITNTSGVLLAVKVADCLPVIVADRKRRAVGIFHAGWRGTAQRIVEKGIGEMRRQLGCNPPTSSPSSAPASEPAAMKSARRSKTSSTPSSPTPASSSKTSSIAGASKPSTPCSS